MRHKWETHPDSESIRRPCQRVRVCSVCGMEQTWESDHEWGRVAKRYWYPKSLTCGGEEHLRHPDQASEEKSVRRLLLRFFDGDTAKAELWWCTSNPMLGGLTPDSLIVLRPGKLLKIVKQALAENVR